MEVDVVGEELWVVRYRLQLPHPDGNKTLSGTKQTTPCLHGNAFLPPRPIAFSFLSASFIFRPLILRA